MSRPEDFDIVDDDEELPRRMPAWWVWLGGAALLIVLGGIFAIATFSQRVSSPSVPVAEASPTPVTQEQTPGAGALLPGSTPTQVPEISPEPSPTTTVTPLPTETPTSTPIPSPTPCVVEVAGEFAGRYDGAELGCPTSSAQTVWAAWQPFERGQMFWRRDTDQAFILSATGIYTPVDERWDGTQSADRGEPPSGLYAPERGFGAVWARSDEIFNILGWATLPERGFCARIQDYEYGAMVTSDPTPSCTPENLYNHATASDWQPLFFRFTEAGSWR